MGFDPQPVLEDVFGPGTAVSGTQAAAGGCIHDSRILQLQDGRQVFVKTHSSPPDGIFSAEAAGLRALGDTAGRLDPETALRVPEVLAHDDGDDLAGAPFLLLEAIPSGSPSAGFFERFGRALAELHRASGRSGQSPSTWGFEHDNYLGATPQPNESRPTWTAFWDEQRLGFQIERARRAGLSDPELDTAVDRLRSRLPELLDPVDEPPSLLHGDLWSGNFMVHGDGTPVLIDPAVYRGQREAELAMCRLFGGFPGEFFVAYDAAWPLADGHRERQPLYELYHLLNHLNLFGRGYRAGCMACLRRLV